jgi:starch synthase
MEETFSPNFTKKLKMDGVTADDMKHYKEPTMANIHLAAMKLSDAVIKGCDTKHATVDSWLKKSNKPVLEYKPFDDEGAFVNACSDFYDELLEQEPVLQD